MRGEMPACLADRIGVKSKYGTSGPQSLTVSLRAASMNFDA
jgi:hypothetical protein